MARYYNEKQKVILWWRQDGRCGLCGVSMDKSVDPRAEYHHILKYADGGITSIDNGVMLCKECHVQSHNIGRFRDSVSVSYNEYKYANFSANGESKYSGAISEIKRSLSKLNDHKFNSDIFSEKKEVISKAFEVMDRFKRLRMDRIDKNELFDKFNSIKKNIDEKFQAKIKDNYSKAYNLTCEAQNLARSIDDLRKVPEAIKELQGDARKYMLAKKERDEIRKRFQEAWDTLNKRNKKSQEEYEKESNKNYRHVSDSVTSVRGKINKYSNLKELRVILKNSQAYMKGKKFKKEQRQELFDLINNTFERINNQFQENRREYDRECENNKIRTLDKLNGFYISEDVDFKEKEAI